MQKNHPLNKVVFIQKVAAFANKKTDSLKDLFQLAYVNNSWNDTIKNYSFHLFQKHLRDVANADTLEKVCETVIKSNVVWFVDILTSSETWKCINLPQLVCKNNEVSLGIARLVFDKIVEGEGHCLLKNQLVAWDKIGRHCVMFACRHSSSPEVVQFIFEKLVEIGGIELLKNQLVSTNKFGWTTLTYASCNPSSPAVVKLLAVVLFELGLFKGQYGEFDDEARQGLAEKVNEIKDDSWTPDADSIAEVKKMLKC